MLGFSPHVRANFAGPMETLREDFLFGPPAFAPLSLADLAMPVALGLWSSGSARDGRESSRHNAPRERGWARTLGCLAILRRWEHDKKNP